MNISYLKANEKDSELLIEMYNKAFLSDYLKYGECPAYGRTIESMNLSLQKSEKHIIAVDDIPVGVISFENRGDGNYYLGCLCLIPEYQHRGLGTEAFQYALEYYSDWRVITLVTPEDKTENINFYTKKCGFSINDTEIDGNVKVVKFILQRDI